MKKEKRVGRNLLDGFLVQVKHGSWVALADMARHVLSHGPEPDPSRRHREGTSELAFGRKVQNEGKGGGYLSFPPSLLPSFPPSLLPSFPPSLLPRFSTCFEPHDTGS